MPTKSKTHHIVHNSNGGWEVKRGGGNGRIAQSDTHGRDPAEQYQNTLERQGLVSSVSKQRAFEEVL